MKSTLPRFQFIAFAALVFCLTPATALAQNYQGYLDAANCSIIGGWAEDANNLGSSINVDIYDGSTFVTTAPANLYRSDVGYHAYTILTPSSLKNSQYHYIYVKYGGTNLLLNNSDQPLYCNSTSNGYQYYYSDNFSSIDPAAWSQNGTLSAGGSGLTSSATNGGSVISKAAIPDGTSMYEVKATLLLTSAGGGNYSLFLQGTSNALYGPAPSGSGYVMEVQSPNCNADASYCFAPLALSKIVNGSITSLGTSSFGIHTGSVIRLIYTSSNQIAGFVDNKFVFWAQDSSIAAGKPGVGVRGAPSGEGISRVDLGPHDGTAPMAVSATSIATAPFNDRIEMQWPGVPDDPNGIGVAFYQFIRNGVGIATLLQTTYTDLGLSAGTVYNDGLYVCDYHLNCATTAFNVTTAPANSIDPRQVGVRPTASYWGGGGEKIDMRSGNLNYTVPLIKAMARSGWNASFNLSYNSENWRQDTAGTWQLARESGYGYGWRLQAGSLTPIYQDYWTIHHYVFTDATGAEYRLLTNTGGVWTSNEGVYISWDTNTGRLYFPDGSFWTFGSFSAGTEQDSGTLYPTLMEDTNGNQVAIVYNPGNGVGVVNTSSRIQSIQDLRGTFNFSYDYQNTVPRLSSITNNIGTAERYTFSYTPSTALLSPWNGQNFGTISLLSGLTQTGTNLTTGFTYDTSGGGYAGTGELAQVTTPYGGHLRWTYQANTYVGSRTFREVQYRYLSQSSGAAETAVSLNHDPGDNSRNVHYYTYLVDGPSNAGKLWYFQTDTSQFSAGMAFLYQETTYSIGASLLRQDLTWSQTPTSANPYISAIVTTLNTSTSYQISKMTTQTLDRYGNLTQMQVYDFGNLSTPVRTYTNTYLTNSNYTSRYIFNRLKTSTVTDGTRTTTLSQIYYDGEPGSCGGFAFTDPSTQPAPMGMHDTSYGINFFYRGMPGTVVTPASTVCTNYDIGGNVTSSSTNGLTTTATTASGSDYAVPTAMTTGSLTNTMSYNGALAPTSTSGPNGDTSSLGYDGNLRPSSTTSPFGAQTAFVYNDTQSPPMVIATTSGANTNTHWARTTKDGFGRTIKSETGSGTGSSTATALSVVDAVYAPYGCSPLGKLWKTSMPHAPNATPVWTVYTYDGSGRTLSVTSPDGSSATTYSYQGNTVTVTDPAGKWKKFTMDAMGNLTSVLEPDPTYTTVTTSYTYDILNHLTNVSMPRGSTTQTRTFNYTSGTTVGAHLLSATNPENGTVSYTYNTDHTLNTKTDAKAQQFTYTYDGYKRLLTVSVGGNVLRTYSYDTNPYDANYSQYAAGRLTAIQYPAINYNVYTGSPGGSTTFTDMFSYWPAGNVAGKRLRVTKVQPYGNGLPHTQTAVGDLNMAYSYNYEGKPISVTYPTDVYGTTPQFTYSYDNMMRPAGMTDQTNASIVSGVQYGLANELLQMTYIGGATETRQYNSMLQLTNIIGAGQNITYTFPPAGQNAGKIASLTDNISGETINYAYDSLNRLISAAATSNAWSQTYAYDGFGNLTGRVGTGAAQSTTISTPANLATNQLSGYSYDQNGNQISTGYDYDAENRMVQANAGAVRYGYDRQNKRIWQGNFSNSTGDWLLTSDLISVFGIDGKMIGTYNPQPNWNNTQTQITIPFYGGGERVYFGRKLVAKMGGSGYLVSVAQDRLESVGKYYPFGEERNSPPLTNDNVKFATYTRDSATGLDYADQRYYANTFGRFMSPDPSNASAELRNPQSWNRYAYVENDPVNANDPSGLYLGSPDDPGTDLSCTILDVFDTIWCGWILRPLPIFKPTPAMLRAARIEQIADEDLSDLIQDWSFANSNATAINVVFSDDYRQFLDYLQTAECGCPTIDWSSILQNVKNAELLMRLPALIALNAIFKKDKPIGRPKSGLPTGTKGIDEMGWDKDRIRDIKKGVGARAPDWTGIDEEGNVWTGSPDGTAQNHGPWGQYTHN